MIGRNVLSIVIAGLASLAIAVLTFTYLEADGLSLERVRSEVEAIENGKLSASVSLVDGAHKPLLKYGGKSALEFSDWASEVSTESDHRSLWETRFRVESWDDVDEIIHTRYAPTYEIAQVTSLKQDHAVISYYVSPVGGAELGSIALTIAHYRWYFEEIAAKDEALLLTSDSEPEQIWFRSTLDGELETHSDEIGTHSFTMRYVLDGPPRGQQTLIVQEEVWFVPPPPKRFSRS